jgi:hypothetical protein
VYLARLCASARCAGSRPRAAAACSQALAGRFTVPQARPSGSKDVISRRAMNGAELATSSWVGDPRSRIGAAGAEELAWRALLRNGRARVRGLSPGRVPATVATRIGRGKQRSRPRGRGQASPVSATVIYANTGTVHRANDNYTLTAQMSAGRHGWNIERSAHARRRSRPAGPASCHRHPAAHAGTASTIIRVPVPSSGNYRGGFGLNGGSGQL